MNLIIVESPTKARTLTRFLGDKKYRVEATMGHIRDLPKAALGVDVEHDFTPSYVIPRDRQKRVGELKDLAKKADSIILATDPDREGEAIAWHVGEILRLDSRIKRLDKEARKSKGEKNQSSSVKFQNPASNIQRLSSIQRIVFHEITETAIKDALAHPRSIDLKLVDAQQARRVLDRLVGYNLSPLLWQKLSRRWLSAGRVQSVAVRLIVMREREIAEFASEEYWTIDGVFSCKEKVVARLVAKDGVKYEKTLTYDLFDGTYTTASSTIQNEQTATGIIGDLQPPFVVSAVDKKQIKRYPFPPFTTSTLQQDSGRKLGYSAKKTMQLAQKLYEEGIITYHRTDSVNLSEKFIGEARAYIKKIYGPPYVPDDARRYQTKSKLAQEAHEAIRPTNVAVDGAAIKNEQEFNHDHARLYELIWKRAVASQAKEAVFDSTKINITSSNGYLFEAQGSVVMFDGYLKITGRENGEVIMPAVAVGQDVKLVEGIPSQHNTSPPPRYTEAALVKTLEEKGIGRPSTYAPIISTVVERQYVQKQDKKLMPTDLGSTVTDFLVRYFVNIMELPFTAKFEDELDDIARGTKEWVPVIRDFFAPFHELLTEHIGTQKK